VSAAAGRRLRALAVALLVAVLPAGHARTFLVQPYRVRSASMAPNLLVGDQLLVNRFVWSWQPAAAPVCGARVRWGRVLRLVR
jgi:signal peptidase I